ncbi:PREDICTED: uncharacterized protein LOC108783145 [Cyphomyrmex costatus]|uniref:uncharacterized protein LOC108783145 n=1 Tax=Cyphomyrmex costatus TaxID=456900 RepID=UPI0008523F23|nr:PREDICTED: uncharacterized protein LOC108783145 [Cyphomyrmex costatus]
MVSRISASRRHCLLGYTFRVDYDIWTTGGSQISCGEVESPFRKLAPTLYPCLMTTSRLIPLIIFGLQTPYLCAEISWGHMASESRSPVIPANLVETLPELHPFTEKGTRNRGDLDSVSVGDSWRSLCRAKREKLQAELSSGFETRFQLTGKLLDSKWRLVREHRANGIDNKQELQRANDGTNTMTPLTEKQIVSTIHNVLLVLIKKDFDDKNNLFEMFNSASAVTTSEISVQQIKQEPKIQDIIRSQDAQHVQSDDDSSSFSDISLKDIKKERENSFNTLQNVKKCISQSNPAIYVTNISRSDTFIREENPKDTNDEDVFKNLTDAEMIGETDLSSDLCQVSFNERKSNLSSGFFHTSLKEIRKSVMDIMTKLNDLEQSFSQLTNSPREVTAKAKKSCLVNRHRSPDYVSVQTKTSINNHRSSSTSSKTSNSSKQLAKENTCISERRKSTGAIGKVTPVKKSNESTNVNNSVSSMDFSPYKPVESSEYRPKFTKNPKYAHVRSTIPKAISQKKKFQ